VYFYTESISTEQELYAVVLDKALFKRAGVSFTEQWTFLPRPLPLRIVLFSFHLI